VNLQHMFTSGRIWEPLYQWEKKLLPVEIELFQSPQVRRLKFLHHFGASALFSPIIHSRFEHTIGVWSLMANFFPNEPLLRVAALLHDVGHLPFSHAVERTLGFDHHAHTERLIGSGSIARILIKHAISPESIIAILSQDSPLTNKTPILGLDHLDSFLRDTHAAGFVNTPPHELVRRIRFRGDFIETDSETAQAIVAATVEDHRLFLNPEFLAMDALLAKAVTLHCEAHPGTKERICDMVDHELIYELQNSKADGAKGIMSVILHEPHHIQIHQVPAPGSIQVQIQKLYKKQPLIGELPASEASPAIAAKLAELDGLTATYFFTYS
jgi:HD superfamily phosphohydrolase